MTLAAASLDYLIKNPAPVDQAAFDKYCGVGALTLSSPLVRYQSPTRPDLLCLTGFSATPEEILGRVQAYVETNNGDVTKLGWPGIGKTTGLMKATESLRWVNALELKGAVDSVYETLFGKKEDKAAAAAKAKKVR